MKWDDSEAIIMELWSCYGNYHAFDDADEKGMSDQAKIARCREKNRALSESFTLHGLATTFTATYTEGTCTEDTFGTTCYEGTFAACTEGISVSLIISIFSSYPYPLGEGSFTGLT